VSRPYQPAFSEQALEALLEADRAQRAVVRAAVLRLCRTPGQTGDYCVLDDTGRPLNVVLIDGAVITFWADHAVRELRVALIEFP
jgi:hypothetical protein